MMFAWLLLGILLGTAWLLWWSRYNSHTLCKMPHVFLWKKIAGTTRLAKTSFRLSHWFMWSWLCFFLLWLSWYNPWKLLSSEKITIFLDASASMWTYSSVANKFIWESAQELVVQSLQDIQNESIHVEIILYPTGKKFYGKQVESIPWLYEQSPCYCTGDLTTFFANWQSKYNATSAILITDGNEVVPPLENIFVLYCGITQTNNIGITAATADSIGNGKVLLWGLLRNFGKLEHTGNIKVIANHLEIAQISLTLPGMQESSFMREIFVGQECTSIDLIWPDTDNFSLDNQVYLVKEMDCFWDIRVKDHTQELWKKIPMFISGIQIIRDSNDILENTPRKPLSTKNTRNGIAPDVIDTTFSTDNHGDFFLDKIPNSSAYVLIASHSGYSIEDFTVGNMVVKPNCMANPGFTIIASYPDLWKIPCAFPLQRPQNGTTILSCKEGGLIVATASWIYIGFDPTASYWPNLPAFPIFWESVLNVLAPTRSKWQPKSNSNTLLTTKKSTDISTTITFLLPKESDNLGIYLLKKFSEWKSSVHSEMSILYRSVTTILALFLLIWLWTWS